jgi:hypothetical protein
MEKQRDKERCKEWKDRKIKGNGKSGKTERQSDKETER